MKKITSLLILLLSIIVLSGCVVIDNGGEKNTKKSESIVDKQALIEEIYNEVYQKIEDELRSEIREEIVDSFSGGVSLDSLQDQIYKVVNECSKGNVGITNLKKNDSGEYIAAATGSGVIYDALTVIPENAFENTSLENGKTRYYVITNEHVTENGDHYYVTFSDESQVDAFLVGADKTTDIAVLYFDSENTYKVNKLGTSENTKVGSIVLAIGNPKGETLFGSVSFGIIGGVDRNLVEDGTRNTINSYLQHDAAINSGNSGGGLYNLNSECIGINSVKYAASDIEGLNFSIPIDLVKKVTSQLREYGEYNGTVSFGISVANVSDLTQAGRVEYSVDSKITSGVVVISVTENSSADGLLMANDIIIEIDSKEVLSTNEVASVIKEHIIGDTVSVKVLRLNTETNERSEVTVSVTFKRVK